MRSLVLGVLLASAPARAGNPTRDTAALQRVVQTSMTALRACYDDASKRAPGLTGKFVYTIAIGKDGHVAKAAPKAPTKASAALDACITAEIGKLAFGPGPEVTLAYPFLFEAAAPPAAAEPPTGGVDPALVKMFDEAVDQGRAGKHAVALAGYRAVLDLQRRKKLAVIPRVIATVHLDITYELIDLGKLAEAEKEIALVDSSTLTKAKVYDYHFTRANILGGEGKVRPMFAEMVEAISAAEDLDDLVERPPLCWTKILAFTMKAQDWAYLEEVSQKALQVAQLRGYKEVELKATIALSEARKHLKK